MNLGLIPSKAKPVNGQATGNTSKRRPLTAAEKPLAGQLMPSLPIRGGAQKAGPAQNQPKQPFSSVSQFPQRRQRLRCSSWGLQFETQALEIPITRTSTGKVHRNKGNSYACQWQNSRPRKELIIISGAWAIWQVCLVNLLEPISA